MATFSMWCTLEATLSTKWESGCASMPIDYTTK